MSQYYGPPQGPPPGPPPSNWAPYPPVTPPPPRKKHTALKVIAGVLGALLLIGIGARLGGGDRAEPTAERSGLDVAAQPEAEAPTPAAQQDTPAVTPTPTSSPAEKPKTYQGVGAKVVKVKQTEHALLAELTHSGSSNFIVSPVDPGGAEQASIVNEIGRYKGTVLVNEEDGKVLRAFKIQADGPWTLTLKPLALARVWDGGSIRASGRGDDVIALAPPASGLTTMKVNHSGSHNFIVDSYSESSRDLLVNEIGSYRGEVLLPDATFLIAVHADGKWSFTKG
ncbi:hypothetical protein [Nonomuraea pusilla]|uniref:Uncharacterized protein n=1 Tax=Nonomuraea pusilla TaxID=46177 RepID=A0A1H7M6T4_9ACTN|nr:hypothetical protein [Nonomuraea pusilla]SEL06904.1 hypothetical protein SAMN05660976_01786 [Nonomuraea pusilla]